MSFLEMSMLKEKISIIFISDLEGGFHINLAVGVLSACLKRAGFCRVKICAKRFTEVRKLINPGEFTFIAFSTGTAQIRSYLRFARKLKRRFPAIVTLFGGPHPTFVPEIIYEEGIDAVCRGEGEESLVQFLENYDYQNKKVPENIHGWWVKASDGRIIKNSMAPLQRDLDSFPDPDRRIFPFNDKFHFIFSRGCPNSCAYCSMPALRSLYGATFKEYFRVRSVEKVLSEIKTTIVSFGRQPLIFHDSIFGLDRDWLREFSPRYKLEVGLPFICNSTVKNIDREYLQLLQEAGCEEIYLGLETADEEVRKKLLRKNFSNADFLSAVDMICAHKIKIGVYIIAGLPGGKIEDDLKSVAMILDNSSKIENILLQVLSYLPGTEIRRLKKNFFCQRKENFRFSSNILFPSLNYKALRKDLPLLWRLQSLLTLSEYLNIQRMNIKFSDYVLRPKVLKFLIFMPIFHISNVLTKVLMRHNQVKNRQESFFKKEG